VDGAKNDLLPDVSVSGSSCEGRIFPIFVGGNGVVGWTSRFLSSSSSLKVEGYSWWSRRCILSTRDSTEPIEEDDSPLSCGCSCLFGCCLVLKERIESESTSPFITFDLLMLEFLLWIERGLFITEKGVAGAGEGGTSDEVPISPA
jgi:hypothetical protein